MDFIKKEENFLISYQTFNKSFAIKILLQKLVSKIIYCCNTKEEKIKIANVCYNLGIDFAIAYSNTNDHTVLTNSNNCKEDPIVYIASPKNALFLLKKDYLLVMDEPNYNSHLLGSECLRDNIELLMNTSNKTILLSSIQINLNKIIKDNLKTKECKIKTFIDKKIDLICEIRTIDDELVTLSDDVLYNILHKREQLSENLLSILESLDSTSDNLLSVLESLDSTSDNLLSVLESLDSTSDNLLSVLESLDSTSDNLLSVLESLDSTSDEISNNKVSILILHNDPIKYDLKKFDVILKDMDLYFKNNKPVKKYIKTEFDIDTISKMNISNEIKVLLFNKIGIHDTSSKKLDNCYNDFIKDCIKNNDLLFLISNFDHQSKDIETTNKLVENQSKDLEINKDLGTNKLVESYINNLFEFTFSKIYVTDDFMKKKSANDLLQLIYKNNLRYIIVENNIKELLLNYPKTENINIEKTVIDYLEDNKEINKENILPLSMVINNKSYRRLKKDL